MNKTILVTGSAGFIGFNVCKKLLKKDVPVVGIDNINRAYNTEFKKQNTSILQKYSHFSFYKIDIRKRRSLEKVFKNGSIHKVIHLAARTGIRKSLQYSKLYFQTNVIGTQNVYEFACKYDVKQFIFASSSSIYGNTRHIPFSEMNKFPQGTSPYARSKQRAEKLLKKLHKKYKMPTTILRFFSVYGPFGRPDMAPYIFTKKILANKSITQYGPGNTSRDYTYIDDIIAGILKALDNSFDFEIINLGNHTPITLKKLITTIEDITGMIAQRKVIPARKEEALKTWANIEKAQNLLHWKPKTSFEKGMKTFVLWYKNNRVKNT